MSRLQYAIHVLSPWWVFHKFVHSLTYGDNMFLNTFYFFKQLHVHLESYFCYHLVVFYNFGVVFKYIILMVSTSTIVLTIYAKFVPTCKPIIHMENNLI